MMLRAPAPGRRPATGARYAFPSMTSTVADVGDAEYFRAFDQLLLRVARAFEAQLAIVSVGAFLKALVLIRITQNGTQPAPELGLRLTEAGPAGARCSAVFLYRGWSPGWGRPCLPLPRAAGIDRRLR
jgi:hypothetical protein